MLLRVFDPAHDLLFIRVGLDDLDHLCAGGQDFAHLFIAAHPDADAGTRLLRALRHGRQVQMAERRGHKRHAEGFSQEPEGCVRLHRADNPALHKQGIHILPRDLYRIAPGFTEHNLSSRSLLFIFQF